MSIYRALRFTRRRFVSSLFSFTFFATVITVSASNILPCPARPQRGRFADSDEERMPVAVSDVNVTKRPRRWIEEKHPN
ncbi:uncharacterized protein LACBIDRAFT_311995 [Laccaria bicolor S238N-H82]|uniref:Predicted protein n=1 Tax=Laccaria bicolor (strain S238N-H82 / ATCC MYA-4686) TaxID=486041 RepID=B0CYT7_LACBS|nr:uncharacterized protein LACBIDRAFT_311995 [Laccaria bicolor S238N-H82]EDR12940.1 predicted protein [Laccaria bicolor S238N-H82]|eukprot:XP_001877204.1 predicted protein [Laccaria bicolor S238N-H82]